MYIFILSFQSFCFLCTPYFNNYGFWFVTSVARSSALIFVWQHFYGNFFCNKYYKLGTWNCPCVYNEFSGFRGCEVEVQTLLEDADSYAKYDLGNGKIRK